jgi:hypothetical protein
MDSWWRLDSNTAEFFLKCLTSVGTITAVLLALFGDYFREKFDPVQIKIEMPPENNSVFDKNNYDGVLFDVYCHHLRVVNLTPHRAIRNCRVWMKQILVWNVSGNWREEVKTPVPRMMEWAPNEYSKDVRTFCKHQVFDFGQTLSNNGGFALTILKEQGGTFNRRFPVGKKLRFIFYVTADNYLVEETFCFEVDVSQSVQGETVTPSRITPVSHFKGVAKRSVLTIDNP